MACNCRLVEGKNANGTLSQMVKPYVLDLGSVNGTTLQNDRLEPERYYELMNKVGEMCDMLPFPIMQGF